MVEKEAKKVILNVAERELLSMVKQKENELKNQLLQIQQGFQHYFKDIAKSRNLDVSEEDVFSLNEEITEIQVQG